MLYFLLASLLGLVCHISGTLASAAYGSQRLTAYVVEWSLPKEIPWEMLDHIAYAFAIPDQHGRLTHFNHQILSKIVNEAHSRKKGVSLSVGGWTGSVYFSSLVSTDESRENFTNTLVQTVKQFDLNGLNVDWEYPNDPNGVSCNEKKPKDTENLLKFFQLLRKKLDIAFPEEHKLITAAVSANVFNDEKATPYVTLDQGWSTALDSIFIMAYDLTGIWSDKTGPNAPLYSDSKSSSVDTSVKLWINAGIPRERIVVGVPFYGYKTLTQIRPSKSSPINVDQRLSHPQIQGDKHDKKEKEPCPGSRFSYSGEMQWRTINEMRILHGRGAWTTSWDSKSQTYYSFNMKRNEFLSFDTPRSLQLKATYVVKNKLGGVMLWSLDMDDAKHSLIRSLQSVRR
ncbi:glycoside hydrolase superfamily [Spinellus fusiger]|nr:glycoside hydrolase superfamily [Spinellus fusiger]